MERREILRMAFNDDAGRYDLTRPRYPDDLYNDLAAYAELRPRAAVFEIGCGTGQATLQMAARGWAVHAVDVGDRLAEYAARRLVSFPRVEVEQAAFDEMPLPARTYAAVTAFTSFHWLDPVVRVQRAAALLEPGGCLAIVDTHHVAGSDPFFAKATGCYLRWHPEPMPDPPPAEAVEVDVSEVADSGWFSDVEVRHYPAEILYTRDQYLDLLRTYADHAVLAPEAQAGLFACLSRLIDDLGGAVHKSYVFSLLLARRTEAPALV